MIQPENESGGGQPAPSEIALFTIAPALRLMPRGNNILLQYEKPTKAGEFVLPHNAKSPETLVAEVLEVGPECKFIKKGDRVVILTKALIGGVEGLMVEGKRVYLSQEQVVIGVLETPAAESQPTE